MKKRYLLILLITLLFITGCDVKYTLNYNEGTFREEIKINDFYSHSGLEMFPEISDLEANGYYADNDGSMKYEQKIYPKGNDIYDIDLSSTYQAVSFKESNLFSNCFELNTYEEQEDYIYVSAYGKFACDYADNITINFKSDKAIISHNAQSVKNGVLTWFKDDLSDAGIRVQISKKVAVEPAKKANYLGLIFQLALFSGLIGIILYIRKKDRENN